MRADDGTDVADFDRARVHLTQLGDERVDVGALCVQHRKVGDVAVLLHLLDEERKGLGPRALAATFFDLALADVDDRLDGESRGDHGLGTADAAALLQVLQSVERPVHVDTGGQRAALCLDLVESGPRGGGLRTRTGNDALTHRDAAAVDDADRNVAAHGAGGDLRALHRGRQRRRQ